jgi:site-specific recombinase XerD
MADERDPLVAFVRHQRSKGLSPRTIKRRSWSLGELAASVDPSPIVAASSADIEDLLLRWASPQTRKSVLSDVRVFFTWAVRRGLVESNPASMLEVPKVPKRAPTPIRPQDVLRAVRASEGDVRLMVLLGAYAGLRVSEIAALAGRDVHQYRGVLVVRAGKGGKDREVPLSSELATALAGCTSGRLFGQMTGRAVSHRIKRLFLALGIDARPHDLRASFATQLARRARGDVVAVARLMGHESVQTTERYMGYTPETAALVEHLYE